MYRSLRLLLLSLILVLASFLRLSSLDTLPPSPYWEEVALGYDAYSILKTGKDHHGNPWPVVAFESFGDWKPSLYFYTVVPSVALFDLSVWAVRFPSALAGILTVLCTYLLIREILTDRKYKDSVSLLTAFFLAVTPWHILTSRVAFETNLGSFLVTLGSWLFYSWKRKKSLLALLLSSISFALSLYSYHGFRVFTPLLVTFLVISSYKTLLASKKTVALSFAVFVLLTLPVLIKMRDPQVTQRFGQTSAFATLEPILQSNAAIAKHGGSLVARLLHHRFWYYGKIFTENYVSHFSSNFLFIKGDENLRHSVGLIGQLYWVQLPLILLGLFYLFRNKTWNMGFIVGWLLLSPVAAGVTKATPHALRALPMVIAFSALAAFGLGSLLMNIRSLPFKKTVNREISFAVLLLGLGLTLFETTRFYDYYQHFYPKKTSQLWQYGYGEMVDYIEGNKESYDQVIVTRDQGRPAMYYWFYTKEDPRKVQEWDKLSPKDQGEYLQFENIYFGIEPNEKGKRLIVTTAPSETGRLLKTIPALDGSEAFLIYED